MASKFYMPALTILKNNAPNPMTANEIKKIIIEQYPDIVWSGTQGPIRAMLLRAASLNNSHIKLVLGNNSSPPSFYYQELSDNSDNAETIPEPSPEEKMDDAYQFATDSLKEELRQRVRGLSDTHFEELVNQLISKMGFGQAKTTRRSHDGGIDGYIYGDRLGFNVICVQSKHFTEHNVQSKDIHSFIGALNGRDGVFVTSSDFSSGAKAVANNIKNGSHLVLINGDQLLDYMIEYNVGVQETGKKYILKQIDSDFFIEL